VTPTTIVDTGPLVALLNRRESHHEWVKAQLAEASPPLLTCDAVLAEAAYLLRDIDRGAQGLMGLVKRGMLRPAFRMDEQADAVGRLMQRYVDVPMSLADACLVRMTELHAGGVVLTLDGDFLVYRRHGRQVVPCLLPGAR
jgi:predicted nucleic acid-binding protein